MDYYTKKLVKSQVIIWIILLLSFISMLMAFNGFLKPETQESSIWFQRSGSIAVILSIFAELFFIKESIGLAEEDECEVEDKYKPLIITTNISAVILIVLGTFVWGYGDLMYNYIKN